MPTNTPGMEWACLGGRFHAGIDTRQKGRISVGQGTKDQPDGPSVRPGPALSRVYLFDLGQSELFDGVGLLHSEDKGCAAIGLLDDSRNLLVQREGTGGQADIDLSFLYRFDASCAADTGEQAYGAVGMSLLKTVGHPLHDADGRTRTGNNQGFLGTRGSCTCNRSHEQQGGEDKGLISQAARCQLVSSASQQSLPRHFAKPAEALDDRVRGCLFMGILALWTALPTGIRAHRYT